MSILQFLFVTVSVMVVVNLADDKTGLPDECLEPMVVGPCRAFIQRYFYNTATSSCDLFGYGGCLGNLNNFDTEEACKIRCMRHGLIKHGSFSL